MLPPLPGEHVYPLGPVARHPHAPGPLAGAGLQLGGHLVPLQPRGGAAVLHQGVLGGGCDYIFTIKSYVCLLFTIRIFLLVLGEGEVE